MAEAAPRTGSARPAERPVDRNSRRDVLELIETPQQVKNQQLERVWGLERGWVGDARHKGKYLTFAARGAAKERYPTLCERNAVCYRIL
jgi:hypothetical protein